MYWLSGILVPKVPSEICGFYPQESAITTANTVMLPRHKFHFMKGTTPSNKCVSTSHGIYSTQNGIFVVLDINYAQDKFKKINRCIESQPWHDRLEVWHISLVTWLLVLSARTSCLVIVDDMYLVLYHYVMCGMYLCFMDVVFSQSYPLVISWGFQHYCCGTLWEHF